MIIGIKLNLFIGYFCEIEYNDKCYGKNLLFLKKIIVVVVVFV